MKQLFKNIWWQLKANTYGRLFWVSITIDNMLDDTLLWVFEESIKTGKCVEQIIQDVLQEYVRRNK
jgi:hypothetical protein